MYKILSLDGGGIGGLYTASLLATWEDKFNVRVADYFDLIVGTSTGGIIALGIGASFSAAEICEFYMEEGPKIFSKRTFRKGLFKTKYNSKELESSLGKKFNKLLLGHSSNRLVIPTFNLDEGKPRVYKTAHNERFILDYQKSMLEVALATSAAPTFFPSYSKKGLAYVDGGVWANNPVAVAVIEALAILDWPVNSFKVLSIGCPLNTPSYGLATRLPLGSAYWAAKVAPLFMQSASEYALNTAKLLTKHNDEKNKVIHRIQTALIGNSFVLDKVQPQHLIKLKTMGEEHGKNYAQQVKEVFFSEKAEPFTSIHKI